MEQARRYEGQGADELVFLDITASAEARFTRVRLARAVARVLFIPFTIGGGIGSLEEIRKLLNAGADKVSINTAAIRNPRLISDAARRFGSQCIVVAIDAKRKGLSPQGLSPPQRQKVAPKGTVPDLKGQSPLKCISEGDRAGTVPWEVYIHGGRTPTGLDAVKWARQAARRGAGEILLTSMDCDGTKEGYDLALTRAVAQAVPIPVIASGGAGNLKHLEEAFKEGKADAALAASIFHYGTYSIPRAKRYLKSRGIPVRL